MDLPASLSFPAAEKEVLDLWKELDAFKTSQELHKDKPSYVFLDGPPFANGLPHYGHILAGTIKDVVTRFYHQRGHNVPRRAGWDCHGLPVERAVDLAHNITSPDQVAEMGIGTYNDLCRASVTKYCKEWEFVLTRLGRWIDFKNDYKTMEPWYMESVWWVLKQLHSKDLVYRGYKVMPYSTACNTPLSNFEANLNYHEDTIDPAVVVTFPVLSKKHPDTSFVAWTTTPWTLPSNLALCVHPTLKYVKVKDLKSGKFYILMEARLVALYPKVGKKGYDPSKDYEIVDSFEGATLGGLEYEAMFPYFEAAYRPRGAFRVLVDSYVTDDAGTGIVHNAPGFGEDDFRVCVAAGIVETRDIPCPVDAVGKFTDVVTDFEGQYVKDADPAIMDVLKARGRLVSKSSITHSYPFCWRSDTPLIYRAVPSWFVNVEAIKDKLVANNAKTYWVPESVGTGRFHQWLANARDWAISRNRYWGTPLPIWTSDDGEEVVVVGSVDELEELSGVRVTDLHRQFVDDITIPSKMGKGDLHRVTEVFDCWFESGSMPYAQVHYPFNEEAKATWSDRFPADFIAEGLDQTRGWFYTLMVLSTALFDKPAFKNLIVNGLVLAEDGKKMSKSLQNYPDPMHVLNKHGADALRMYLINSPVVRAMELKFSEAGVQGIVRGVFLPWFNAARFLDQSIARHEARTGAPFVADLTLASDDLMDRWILASLNVLVAAVNAEMQAYKLYAVPPQLVAFIDQLTNWYVRLSRSRLKSDDPTAPLNTLYSVLLTTTRLMAPFTPFFTEYLYQRLRRFHPAHSDSAVPTTVLGAAQSVHYTSMPTPDASRADPEVIETVACMQAAVEGGRILRDRAAIPVKMPIRTFQIVASNSDVRTKLLTMEGYIKEELNCLNVVVTESDVEWCTVSLVPDGRRLGAKLGQSMKPVLAHVRGMSSEDANAFRLKGSMTVKGHADMEHVLTTEDVHVRRELKAGLDDWIGTSSLRVAATGRSTSASSEEEEAKSEPDFRADLFVAVNTVMDDELIGLGLAREVVSHVQALRKSAGLVLGDPVDVYVSVREPTAVDAEADEVPPPPVTSHLKVGDLAAQLAALKTAAAGAGSGAGAGAGASAPSKKGDKKAGGGGGGKKQQQQKKGGKKQQQQQKKGGKGGKGAGAGAGAGAGGKKKADAGADAGADKVKQLLFAGVPMWQRLLFTSVLVDLPVSKPAATVVYGTDSFSFMGAVVGVSITRPSVHVSPSVAPSTRDALESLSTSFLAAATASGPFNLTVDGRAESLSAGKDIFFSPSDFASQADVQKVWADAGYGSLAGAYK